MTLCTVFKISYNNYHNGINWNMIRVTIAIIVWCMTCGGDGALGDYDDDDNDNNAMMLLTICKDNTLFGRQMDNFHIKWRSKLKFVIYIVSFNSRLRYLMLWCIAMWLLSIRNLSPVEPVCINTSRPMQNVYCVADDIFKWIFLIELIGISMKISLKFVPGGSINNSQAFVQIMAWYRPRDNWLSEPMMVSLLTHICVTWTSIS